MTVKSQEAVLLKTGVPGLDDVLGGGFPAKHVYLVEGEPGTGKTTLALQFLLEGVKNGESGLYVTLSETKAELEEVARSHGWSLDNVNVHELTVTQDELMPDGQYTFFHPSEVELGESTKSLTDAVEKTNPVRVIFDSLSEMRLLARDPLRFRKQILGLKHFFSQKNCTVLLIDDPLGKDVDLQPESLAHGVISLEQIALNYGSERRRLRIKKLRARKFRGGYHDFNLDTGGLTVFPRLIASEHRPAYARGEAGSGLDALDRLLGGGLARGTSNLFIGPAGVGKSSTATQFACGAAARGEKSAFFIFDEVVESFFARAESLNIPIQKFIKKGLIAAQQIDPAEISPGEFASRVRHAVETDGCRLIVIDSLNGYTLAMPEERALIAQLHELITYLNQQGVVTILIASQHGIVGQAQMDSQLHISYLSDSAVHFRFFESRGTVRKAISVIKKRSGPHENTIRELIIKPGAVEVGEPLAEFQGVLTGVPKYVGRDSKLSDSVKVD